MNAFFIGTVTIKDPEKFQQYAVSAKETMDKYKGELLVKGKAQEALAGQLSHQVAVVVQFPDAQQAKRWYTSAEYQALIPLRDEAADINIALYEQA